MAFKLGEMVQETTTTDSSPFTLLGRVGGFRSFDDELDSGDTTIFTIFDASIPPKYESYKGTFTGTATLTANTFIRSSTGSPIVWVGNAVKNVIIGLPGKLMQTLLDFDLAAGYLKLASGSPENLFSTQVVPIPVADGGTNAITATAARTELGALNRSLSEQTLMLSNGDTLYFSAGAPVRLAGGAGNNDRYLRIASGLPVWTALLASHAAYTPTAPLTGTTAQAALDQLAHALSAVTTQATANTNVSSLVAVTDLANLTIPGSPDGAKKYRVIAKVTIGAAAAGGVNVIVRAHVGSAGTTADQEVDRIYDYHSALSANIHTILLVSKPFVPASGNKVTISVEDIIGANNPDTVITYTDCYIEQMRNA